MAELIDHNGRLWSCTDPTLGEVLGTRLVGDALAKYAVMNLGFVSITGGGRFIRMACRPSTLMPPTIIAMLHYVDDQQSATIGFDYYTRAWNHIIVANRIKFRNLLFSLTCAERTDDHRASLLRKSVDGQHSPHRRKVSAARRIFSGAPRLQDVTAPLDKLFGGRWSLHELNTETGHTIVRSIGNSYTPLNPAWFATAVGNSLCSYADEGYGRWVAEHHREALSADQPLFDQVDAVLEFPSLGRARLRYARLTLPVTLHQAPRHVLSAAVSDSSINLRGLSVDKAS